MKMQSVRVFFALCIFVGVIKKQYFCDLKLDYEYIA